VLTPDALLEPNGELEAAWLWPNAEDEDVADRLRQYLTEGYAKAAAVEDEDSLDEAARQWAYHRAFKGVYQRLLALPSTAEDDQGSQSFLLTQIEHVGELADAALAAFEDLVAAAGTTETVPTRMSASVRARFVF
jgi:hypothetical protein